MKTKLSLMAPLALALMLGACSSSPKSSESKNAESTQVSEKRVYTTTDGVPSSDSTTSMGEPAVSRDWPGKSVFTNDVVLNQMHHVNQKEITLSELARKKGSSQSVKDLARMIQSDHQRLEDRVSDLAKRENIKLRAFKPATWETVASDRLKALSGEAFDSAFVDMMSAGHAAVLREYTALAKKLSGTPVGNLLNDAIPSVKNHEHMANNWHAVETPERMPSSTPQSH